MRKPVSGDRPQRTAVTVSPEMLVLIGAGSIGEDPWPDRPVAFEIHFGTARTPASLTFNPGPSREGLEKSKNSDPLTLIVASEACERLLGAALNFDDGSMHYLPAEMRTIALAIRDCTMPKAAREPYRLAKSIELLCEILGGHRSGSLTEVAAPATLSSGDAKRIAAARRLVDEHWNEKLTLSQIARRCGINRSKLAKGFRELYDCTVTEALAERRLAEARRQLIATDLPVGLIGYRSGYLSNASFTRAFGRRFGISPSDFRACGVTA